MDYRISRVAAAVGALALALAPTVPALAASTSPADVLPPGNYTFDTFLTPQYFGAGSFEGDLRIQVAANGTISGHFRNLDVGMFRTVTGGEDGKEIWLDLGTSSSPLLNLRYEGGKLVGGIYSTGQPYSFVASPRATPAL